MPREPLELSLLDEPEIGAANFELSLDDRESLVIVGRANLELDLEGPPRYTSFAC